MVSITYTGELAAIALLSVSLEIDENVLSALQRVPTAVADTKAMEAQIAHISPRYRYMERSVFIGRGFNYATAFEMH